jgi:hypothetical protein
MTTRRKSRHAAQMGQPPLKYVVNRPNLDDAELQSIEIKPSIRDKFDDLCEEAGWVPTETVRDALMILTKLDAPWRRRDSEAALFAFVQHLDFVWMNGWVLLGRKKFKEGVLCVWYRPVYSPTARTIEFCYGPQKTIFKPDGIKDRVDRDKVWLPFTKLFDLPNLARDKQNLYLTGVYEILQRFTYMRGILDPNGPDDSVLRPGRPELPFLPGSAWMKQQGVLLIDNSPKNQHTAAEPRGRPRSQPLDELNADPHVDSEAAYQPSDASSAGKLGSISEHASYPPSLVNGTDSTDSVPETSPQSTELETTRKQKRKATNSPEESATRKQMRLSSDTPEVEPANVTMKRSTHDLYQSHCRQFQRTPCAATLQTIVDLLRSHDVEIEGMEASLLAFVQNFDFVWENERMFIGSRKVKGARRYERVWYKATHRDGFCHGEFSIDAGRQPCSPSVEDVEVEYFWPFLDSLFDMKHLGGASRKQQQFYIAGTYLLLLQYPTLRRYQIPSSGIGIKLAPRVEEFELPFPPQPSQSNAISQVKESPPSEEPASGDNLQPVPNVHCRQSDGSARNLAEVLREQETQGKITAMIQESARAYIASPETTINAVAPASAQFSGPSSTSVIETSGLSQQPHEQGVLGGIVGELLRNVQLSGFLENTPKGVKLRVAISLPGNVFREPVLRLCSMVSSETPPVLPSRDCIVKGLERIAMGHVKPQQPAAYQEPVPTSQDRHLRAPVAIMTRVPEQSSSGSLTVDQAREILRGPHACITSSGDAKDGGLELMRLSVLFHHSTYENRAADLTFSTIRSVETLPVSLTRSQAYTALGQYAREDEESQQGV